MKKQIVAVVLATVLVAATQTSGVQVITEYLLAGGHVAFQNVVGNTLVANVPAEIRLLGQLEGATHTGVTAAMSTIALMLVLYAAGILHRQPRAKSIV